MHVITPSSLYSKAATETLLLHLCYFNNIFCVVPYVAYPRQYADVDRLKLYKVQLRSTAQLQHLSRGFSTSDGYLHLHDPCKPIFSPLRILFWALSLDPPYLSSGTCMRVQVRCAAHLGPLAIMCSIPHIFWNSDRAVIEFAWFADR